MSQKIQQPEMTWTVCIWLKQNKWIFSSISHSHKAVGNANPSRWTQFGFNMTILFVFYLSLQSHKTVGNPTIWKEPSASHPNYFLFYLLIISQNSQQSEMLILWHKVYARGPSNLITSGAHTTFADPRQIFKADGNSHHHHSYSSSSSFPKHFS